MRPLVTPVRLLVLALALIANIGFYLPSVPDAPGGGSWPAGSDKVVHVAVFALTVWAVARILAPDRRFPAGWVAIGALAHAILIELYQGAFQPGRSASAADVLADAVGIAAGVGIWWVERRRRAVLAEREDAWAEEDWDDEDGDGWDEGDEGGPDLGPRGRSGR